MSGYSEALLYLASQTDSMPRSVLCDVNTFPMYSVGCTIPRVKYDTGPHAQW
jgi:hypothetical protein